MTFPVAIIVVLMCIVCVAVGIMVTHRYMVARVTDLEGRLRDTAAALAGKEAAAKASITPEPGVASKDMENGLVIKTEKTSHGRVTISYAISDKMSKFGGITEALAFASGYLAKQEDPSVANIMPWGNVMKTDKYFVLKLIMSNILGQINDLQRGANESSKDHEGNEDHENDTRTSSAEASKNGTSGEVQKS